MSIFSIFLEIAPVLPEVFENIFLSRYPTKPYPARSLKFRPALRDYDPYIKTNISRGFLARSEYIDLL